MTTRAAIDFVAFANNVALHLPRGRSYPGACRGMSPKARLRMRPAGKERGPRGRGGVAATYVDAESGRSDAARRDAAVTAAGRISDRLPGRSRACGTPRRRIRARIRARRPQRGRTGAVVRRPGRPSTPIRSRPGLPARSRPPASIGPSQRGRWPGPTRTDNLWICGQLSELPTSSTGLLLSGNVTELVVYFRLAQVVYFRLALRTPAPQRPYPRHGSAREPSPVMIGFAIALGG
jgi:hypothetical protein